MTDSRKVFVMRSRLFLFIFSLLLMAVACVPIEDSRPAADSAHYHYILGLSSLNEQNATEALKEFLKAEKYDARDPEIQAGLARAYWLKQAYDLAEIHFKNAVALSKNNPMYHNNLAALYLSMQRYDDAISSFRKAADNLLFDRPELAWAGIGQAHFKKQDYQAAESAYLKSMELNAQYYMAPYYLGELYYTQDRPEQALAMFDRALGLAPGFSLGHYWRGLVYMKMKNTAKAKESFLEVLHLSPQGETARLAEDYLKIIDK